jgi:hypothetical protein
MCGSVIITNRHGCLCAPLGAVPAAWMAVRMMSSGIGSEENERMLRRWFMRA